mmetsp:Transcript_15892/g.19396  ORF Transcript_15892/g.19396 Transcript_15892/m.19396 type:complete len:610 (+) Transcript_15892:52-1881(+)
MASNRPNQPQLSPAQQAILQEEQRKQQLLNQKLADHVSSYPIKLLFPARVYSSDSSSEISSDDNTTKIVNDSDDTITNANAKNEKPSFLRTSEDLINYRLLETQGLEFFELQGDNDGENKNKNDKKEKNNNGSSMTLAQVTESLHEFVRDLQSSNCYESVHVVLGNKNDSKDHQSTNGKGAGAGSPKTIDVHLKEKNWYKLYVGGGIKHDGIVSTSGSTGMLPKVQFESSASLINVTGLTDISQFSYSVDQTSTPSLSLTHTRPLYSLFNDESTIGNSILNFNNGSKLGITFKGTVDTLDFEQTRSSKDHIQSIGVNIANSTSGSATAQPTLMDNVYLGLDWSLSHRDVIPRRHTSLPYLCDASPDIIACGGPSWKHSISTEYKLNGQFTDDKYSPTAGVDSYGGMEVAGPPGDVGFLKCWSGGALHVPIAGGFLRSLLPQGLAFHSAYHCGMMKSLTFGGLCSTASSGNMTHISDRFYIGGSHQLRGFVPAGIGPRADTGGASTPSGDSVGGDVYYTTTAALSMPFPNDFLSKQNVRLFGFANAGTLTGFESAMNVNAFIRSTRLSVGGGISAGTPIGRLEATYAIPLFYGPRDARRSVQAGIGFTFG